MVEQQAGSERLQSMFGVDETWLKKRHEDIIEPDLPIIDPHHRLWDRR